MMARAAQKYWHWILLGLVILGVVVRLVGFGRVPVSLYWDEMAMWNDAQSIISTGKDLHNRSWFQPLFISYGDFKLPIYIWMVGLSSLLTSDMMVATRLPSLLAGVSMIPAVYFLLSSWLSPTSSKKYAWWSFFPLVAAGVVAVMPWSLHFSRVGYEGHLSAAFLLWSLVFWIKFLKNSEHKLQIAWGGLSVLLGTMAVYTYFSTRFVWPVVVVLLSLVQIKKWPHAALALGFLILWMASLYPMSQADFYKASNEFRLSTTSVLNQPNLPLEINVWREQSGNTFLSRILYNRYAFISRQIGQNMLAHMTPEYLFWRGDANLRHGIGTVGILFAAWTPFFYFGIYWLWKKDWTLGLVLSIWWLVALLPASVPMDVPHALRSLNALPVLAIFTAAGMVGVLSVFSHLGRGARLLTVLCVLGISLTTIWSLVVFVFYSQKVYAWQSAEEWQDGYTQVAEYIEQHRDEYTFVYVNNFDDRFFLYYQPYSGVSWHEIQEMPSQDFRRETFKNVRLNDVDDWNTLEKNSLVISRPERIPNTFSQKDAILGASGKEYFVSVETPQN